jgi:hypothetical protein
MLDVLDCHCVLRLVDPVDDPPLRAWSCAVEARQFVAEGLYDPARYLQERARDELNRRSRDVLGQQF